MTPNISSQSENNSPQNRIAFFYLKSILTLSGPREYSRHAVIITERKISKTEDRLDFEEVFKDLFSWEVQNNCFLRECSDGAFSIKAARDVMHI